MIASKLFVTLGVPLCINAFSLYDAGTGKGVTKACDKAMSADINCNKKAFSFINGDIIEDFTDVGDDEELPHDELCHPCYVKRLEMYKPSPHALNIKWHEEQLELVHKKCSSSTSTETATLTSSKSEPSGAATTAEASEASQEAKSGSESVMSTETPVQTTSSELTVPSAPNAGAKSGQGVSFGYESLMLLLSMNIFFV
ncbi:hypothetical protein QWA68_004077 [Fusarium oxysporum]|nr:hypothetical protein QWA68_004077 [Fusarium oxysporum]